jgi:hypothetical protein
MYNNIILSHESLNIWKMWCCLKERQQILSNIFQYLFDLQRIFKFASVSYSNYDFFPKFRECAGEWGLGRTPCQTERDAPNPSLKLERHVAETTALRPDKSTLGSSVRVSRWACRARSWSEWLTWERWQWETADGGDGVTTWGRRELRTCEEKSSGRCALKWGEMQAWPIACRVAQRDKGIDGGAGAS